MSNTPAHLLPANATSAEVALSQATARLGASAPQCRQMWNPDTCPTAQLPWLAWALSVDEWGSDWTDAQKRAAITASYTIHKHKGTVGAVKAALGALDWETRVIEWHQLSPPGAPYTFAVEITLDARGIQASLYDDATRLALASKNVRSHLIAVRMVHTQPMHLHTASALISAETVSVWPWQAGSAQSSAVVTYGALVTCFDTTSIYPASP